ncbi:hypothetical protein HMPREF0653_00942 [Prevotella disiens JCM 6334 = ATCC 29426]|uniref:Uncharacterized protein n=2 Tax=Prevotella disiens TaxID=28130 RepID=A0A379E1E2_9BACT|nr:hypothetical protein HMPREF0653_00942 [Prevotella disiens JCM 6334 = ATCC 29426]SUB86144.1 Uncharacterised protein [Prevotella disiens]
MIITYIIYFIPLFCIIGIWLEIFVLYSKIKEDIEKINHTIANKNNIEYRKIINEDRR